MTTTKERSAPAGRSAADAGDPSADDRNEVRIVGRMSGEVAERVLPSGDPLVSFRVVTRRPGKGPTRVDTIEVSAWSARTRSAAARLVDGDRVEVEGALRRRFFRGDTGSTSRYEVEAAVVRRPR